MNWQLKNLNIDGTITAQTNLRAALGASIDLSAHQHSLRLWPDKNGMQAVRKAIKDMQPADSAPQLVFYGTGDLNQLSAVLLENLPESAKPVTVVLFDNHPDWFDLPPRYHCGNWLAKVLKNDWVESAILIGQDSEDLKGHSFWFSPIADLFSKRLRIFPYETKSAFVPLKYAPADCAMDARNSNNGTELRFETVSELGVSTLSARLGKELKGKNVYIAIDKDVLRNQDAMTDWEQGRLKLDELLQMIASICQNSNVVGADVCGERAPAPLQGLLKRIDAGRIFQTPPQDFPEATLVNERANLAILNCITQNCSREIASNELSSQPVSSNELNSSKQGSPNSKEVICSY